MTTLTERIPNLLQGISQQPDNRKRPGQLRDSVNTYPDYALGLLKRPGGKFLADLYNAKPSGKWFSILRDQSEKYVGQYADNTFRVWNILDGKPRKVDMGTNTGVPGTCNTTTVQTTLSNYNTAKALTATRLATLQAAQSTYAITFAGQDYTWNSSLVVANNYPTGDITEYVVTGILYSQTGIYTVKVNNSIISAATTLPGGYELGNERTDEHPLIASSGSLVYEAVIATAPAYTSGQLATATTALNTAQTNYNSAVTDEATKKGLYDAAITNCSITSVPTNGYLYGATAEDIELLSLNDYTLVLNKKKVVQMSTATTPANINQAFVEITVVAYNAKYQIILNGTTYSYTTPQTVSTGILDAQVIQSALVTALAAATGFTIVAVGSGIYITRTAAFTIETRGSTNEAGLAVFQDQVANISNLPVQCKNGYIVKVTNSQDVGVDDMYVQFYTTNSAAYGPGVWEETVAPGIVYKLDPLTMPHQLVRQADGSFLYGPISWEDRVVGDLTTNPDPSFVGSTINGIFFYRNRLGLLSNEAVILSKAGDYFNFFVSTAMTVTSDDPIDLTASSTKPVQLNYVSVSSVGLILFGSTEQFLLTTDSDILSPTTAKINTLCSYEADSKVRSITLGTTVAFVTKTALYSKLFELSQINSTSPPTMADQTITVPELIPSATDSMVASPGLSIVSLGTTGSDTIYQYRFYQGTDKREIETWYKWKLTGNLLLQFFDISTFYSVVTDGTACYIVSMDLSQSSEEGFLTLNSGEKTDVCLDMWNVNPYSTYTLGTNKTRVYLPYRDFTYKDLAVVLLGDYIGGSAVLSNESEGSVIYPTVLGTAGSNYFDLDGDYRGRNLVIGYNFNMLVELPKFYKSKRKTDQAESDFTANLIIHRIKVSMGLCGPVNYQVNITGRPDWEITKNVTIPNNYLMNSVNLSSESVHTIPVYQRNNNLLVRIVGDTPFPVSILTLAWEGRYTTGFYTRSIG